ncbi:adhesion G-protein coupled receptor G7-like isoform X2 [Simochromis diagramma]|uniref:adhesion G-protein coupled receptor G7-like isoform X2 n=1 Tax=Simochromis diagramma TaxID=43689 RepID=UPI001A7E4340|nr:adhesion G-protein coupled receptor G7-like isoform X2 [Simochromis diagramma]
MSLFWLLLSLWLTYLSDIDKFYTADQLTACNNPADSFIFTPPHNRLNDNSCKKQTLGQFTFNSTLSGRFAYSNEKCEVGTSSAGKPRALTRCFFMNGSANFSHPQIFQCNLTLSDIQQNLTSPADLEMLATSTQILTSNPEELTAENVTAAAEIANTLLLSANATENVRVAAVATVSQLLNATVPDDTKAKNATLGLTVTLDQLSVNLSLNLNASQSQIVQPNLVVQSAQISAAGTQGVQFTSLKGDSDSFIANRIQLNTNATQVVVGNGFVADALIYIQFPKGEGVRGRQTDPNLSLGFVLYQNDRFFRSKLYMRRRATIRVLSASVRGQEPNMVPQHVEMLFRPIDINGTSLYDFSCVFWNYIQKDWSTSGCSKGNTSDGLMRCFCNHTTNFAALWSYRENYEYAKALDVISIVGLSLSILGLVVTIIYHIKENFFRNTHGQQSNLNSKLALLCIYLSLLAFIITFLSGVQNSSRQNDTKVQGDDLTNDLLNSDEHIEPDRGSCTAVAALLHFLLMATFMWNSVYSTQLVLLVRSMRRSLPTHWTPLSVTLGWGVPGCFMVITLAVSYRVDNPLGYRQEEFCWLAALDKKQQFNFGKPMFWAFLLPIGLILIYNIVLLVLTSMATCKVDTRLTSSNKKSSLRSRFLISLSLAVLLGLSWTLGYFTLLNSGKAYQFFSILFCICTTTQGLQIFILFTARKRAFRATISRSMQYISSVNIPLNSRQYNLQRKWKNCNMNQSKTYKDLSDIEVTTSKTL